MSGPTIEFSEERRRNLAIFVGVSHWVCIIPSMICLFMALFIQLQIEDKIAFIEDYDGAVLPGFLVFSGFFGLAAHILCGKASFSVRLPHKRTKWARYLFPAVIATCVIFLSEFISGTLCFVHIRNLEKAFDVGIKKAMAAYKNDATTKEELDFLQLKMECCGSRTYKEWFYLPWVHPDYLSPPEARLQSLIGLGENFIADDVPFSCCSPRTLRPCINHLVLNNQAHYKYDHRTATTLNTVGCTTILTDFYENSVLTVAGALVLSLSFIQLLLIISGRFLQTSVETSMSNEDKEGVSLGYLFTGPLGAAAGLNTTLASTEPSEYDKLIDTTETTPSQDTESHAGESATEEPLYLDVEADDDAEDEHIYSEGDVEQYLATKFASSMEKFNPVDIASTADDYEQPNPPPPPPPPISSLKGKLTKVNSNYGDYMAMDVSNSSVYENGMTKRYKRQHKDTPIPLHRRSFPGSSKYNRNQSGSYWPNMGSSREPMFRSRLLFSSPKLQRHSPDKYINSRQACQHSSVSHRSPDHKERRHAQYYRPVSPVRIQWPGVTSCRLLSPRRRSPRRSISPPKTVFQKDSSCGCLHAAE